MVKACPPQESEFIAKAEKLLLMKNSYVQMAVTALVASLNPAIIARQNTGIDSEEVR